MAKSGSNRVLGLYVGPNPLEGPQDGAYSNLQNCVIKDKDVVEPRFGVSASSVSMTSIGSQDRFSTLFASSVTGLYGVAGTSSTSAVYDPTVGTQILSGITAPETWSKVRFADARGRCYATTDAGVYRIQSTGTAVAAGGSEAILGGGQLCVGGYNASGFLATNYACMYRAVIVKKMADGSEVVGPPSGRAVLRIPPQRTAAVNDVDRVSNVVTVTTTAAHGFRPGDVVLATFNAGDTDANEFDNGNKTVTTVPAYNQFTYDETDPDYSNAAGSATFDLGPSVGNLIVYLDSLAAADDIIRIYRSEAVTPYSAIPPEDVYQVYEAKLTAANISAGYVVVTDNTPEVLLGAPAYFSPSVEGEAGGNGKPPRAADVCAVGASLVLGNLREPHQLEIRLIATGGSVGLIDGSTITVTRGASNFTVTGETGTVGGGEFGVYSGDTVSRDIERTAQALVDCINIYAGNTFVRAYYVSSGDDAPGIILLKARDFSTTAFTVVSDKGAAFAPQALNTGTALTSLQTSLLSQIAESKAGQPDAFPLYWRYDVGEPNEKLLRVLPVRDNKAIIIKERSVWLRSGIAPNVRLDCLDETLTFAFPNSAAVLDGNVYALSSQGVVSISEGGVAYVGGPVSGFLDFLENDQLGTTTANVWGVVDKSLGCYLLFFGTEADDDTTSKCLVFNPSAKAWSGPWVVDWTAYARSIATGLACVGLPNVPKVANENTVGGDTYGTTTKTVVTRPSTTTVTFADTTDLAVGDMLRFTHTVGPSSTVRRWVITAISGTTVTLNVSHGDIFVEGSSVVSITHGFECIAETVALHKGGAGSDAQVSDVVLLMDEESFQSASVEVAAGDVGQQYLEAKDLSRWGFGGTSRNGQSVTPGDAPWGDYDGMRPERCSVPQGSQRAPFHSVKLKIQEAGAKWRLHGVQLELEPGSIKGRR